MVGSDPFCRNWIWTQSCINCGLTSIPAEPTMHNVPTPSLVLSAYSAVTLRKMFPVHTKRTDRGFQLDRLSSFPIVTPVEDRQPCTYPRRMPIHVTFSKPLAPISEIRRSHGTVANQVASSCRRDHRRVWA